MMTDEPKPLDPARPVRTPEVESRVDQLFLDLLISGGRWRRTLMKNGAKAARTKRGNRDWRTWVRNQALTDASSGPW